MSGYIRIEGLHKTFLNKKEKNEVLKGIDLSIEKGDIFGIVGFSGAGKSPPRRTRQRKGVDR